MSSTADRTSPTGLGRRELRHVTTVLSVTEIISWGVLFYALPVLTTSISADEGWSIPTLVAAFTMAQVVAAAAGIWVGRHIDRVGPRRVMTAGSAVGLVGIAALAWSPTLPAFFAAWVVIGLAMSATLYAPAFTALTHWAGDHRVRALTTVTLVAGFASTVFAPLTAVLERTGDWRATYLWLLVPLAATVPLHWLGLTATWHDATDRTATSRDDGSDHSPRDAVLREPRFLLLVATMTLGGFSVYAVIVNLVPLLAEQGISTTTAAVALGIGGAGQVAGRLFYARLAVRLSPVARNAWTLAAAALTTLGLAVVHDPVVAVHLIAFAAGTARGIFTLVQATAVSDRWGTRAYGARSSILSGAVMVASAAAPWAGAVAASALGSYERAFVLLAACAALAAAVAAAERSGSGDGEQVGVRPRG